MSFASVLVDRARIVSRLESGRTVEGTKQLGDVQGPWFKARLFPDEYPESTGQGGARRMLVKGPHVLCGVRDASGAPIDLGDITPEKRVEIESADVGNETWQVTSGPQLLRKRSGVIGFYFTVRRVE